MPAIMKAMDKQQIRARCCQIRDALSPEQVAIASSQICNHIARWPVFQQAHMVMTYMAFRNEVDLGRLLVDFPNKAWVIPRIVYQPEPRLILHPYNPRRLVRHKYGMLEPDPTLPVINPDQLYLILTPGLAFDWRGFRLGLGGGFYDRFLPGVPAPKVGIVYHALILDSVPIEAHDHPVDYLACEAGVLVRSV
jgi:5-formyltetrahydrofolate cyclo-ligase